jgi:hypothetical protein
MKIEIKLPRMLMCSGVLARAGWAHGPAGAQGPMAPPVRQLGTASAPAPWRALRQWVLETGDKHQAPFIIIDKHQARLWLYAADGKPLGDTPVLLGLARGEPP